MDADHTRKKIGNSNQYPPGQREKSKFNNEILVLSCAQWCPTLCYPMDCTLAGFYVHGIFQARILDWVAISSSRESPWPRDQTSISYVSCIAGEFFTTELLGQLRRLSKFKPWWEVGDPAAFTHVGTVSWENCLFFSRYFSSHFALYSLCPLCQDTREENRWAVVSRAKIKLMHHIHYCMHFFSWRECDFLFMSCFLGNWRLQNPLTLS